MGSSVITRLLNLRMFAAVSFFGLLVSAQLVFLGRTNAGPYINQYSVSTGRVNPQFIVTTPGVGGSVWFADVSSSTGNYEIGNITASGVITDYTIVPSGYTSVNNVGGLAVGPDGNVWFHACGLAPSGSRDVLFGKLDVSIGTVTAGAYNTGNLCGTSLHPGPLAVDPNGYIWAAMRDTTGFFGNQITRFDATGSTTYAWTHSGDNWSGMAAGPSNTLWLTDTQNNQVDKITLTSNSSAVSATTSYAIPTSSSSPTGITVGPDGNMWFAEHTKSKVAKVTPGGTFSEYISPSSSGPNVLTAGPDGALWFTASGSPAKIGRITTAGSISEYSVPGSGNLPVSITVGPDGNMWFADMGTEQVGRVPVGPYFDQYAVSSSHINPQHIVATPGISGSVWFDDYNSSTGSYEIGNITTAGTITDYNIIPSDYSSVNYVAGLVVGQDGNVWFHACAVYSGTGYLTLGKLNVSTGTVTAYSTGQTCGLSTRPGPLAVDSNGNFWMVQEDLTGFANNKLIQFSSTGSYMNSWTHSGTIEDWSSIAAGPSNTLWLTDTRNNDVDKITLSGGSVSAVTSYSIPTSSSSPDGITVGPDGNMWFAEHTKSKVAKVTPSGTFTEYTSPSGSGPSVLTTGPDGALWYTASNSPARIGRVTTPGAITEYMVPGSGNLVYGITTGPGNALWFADMGTEQVGRLGY